MKIMKKNPNTGEREPVAGSGITPTLRAEEIGRNIKFTITDSSGSSTVLLRNGTMLTNLLSAGSTNLSISDSSITSDSLIDIYTDTYGVNPVSVSIADNTIDLTFLPQSNDVFVRVIVR